MIILVAHRSATGAAVAVLPSCVSIMSSISKDETMNGNHNLAWSFDEQWLGRCLLLEP